MTKIKYVHDLDPFDSEIFKTNKIQILVWAESKTFDIAYFPGFMIPRIK